MRAAALQHHNTMQARLTETAEQHREEHQVVRELPEAQALVEGQGRGVVGLHGREERQPEVPGLRGDGPDLRA